MAQPHQTHPVYILAVNEWMLKFHQLPMLELELYQRTVSEPHAIPDMVALVSELLG